MSTRAKNMPKANPTINEIAKLAGVSKKSVSRVLNNESGVSEATRERIQAIMNEAGYVPDRRARALASARSLLLGVAYNNRNPSYVLDILRGSQTAANAAGYEVVMHHVKDDKNAAAEVILFMRRSGCDGLIVTPPLSESATFLAAISEQDWPIIRIAGDNADFPIPQIRYNDRSAALSIANQLVLSGHKDIAFIGGPKSAGPTLRRLSGVKDALSLHQLSIDETRIKYGDFTFESGLACGDELLSATPKPSAIICANDEMAAGVYHSAAKLGISIPTQLSITGFDDSPVASHLWPPLTSVKQPVSEMMALAVEMLIQDRRTQEDNIQQFEADVTFRGSVAPHTP